MKAGIIVLIIGLAIDAGIIYAFIKTKEWQGKARIAKGEVIDYIEETSTSTDDDGHTTTSTSYYPVVRFRALGKEHPIEFKNNVGGSKWYDIGETVEVFYNPGNPVDASIHSFTSQWIGHVVGGVLGVIFTLAGAAIVIVSVTQDIRYGKRYERERREDKSKWTYRYLPVSDIRTVRDEEINGNPAVLVEAHFVHPTTKEEFRLKSELMEKIPEGIVLGSMVKIYFHPDDDSNYYFEMPMVDNRDLKQSLAIEQIFKNNKL